MKSTFRNCLLAGLGGLLALGARTATNWDAAGKAWWKNIEYLASDKLQGRNVGSPGYDLAATYVATQYEKAGLKAAGNGSYFQPVGFTETSLNSSSLALVRGDSTIKVAIPEEAHMGYSAESAESLDAPVVFAGYGLVIPEAQ
jgi:hypothetical protein